MRNSAILFVSLLAFISAGYAQQFPPGMKMHRIQAGKLDAQGWTIANSTEGSFTAKLPCLYNDFTLIEDNNDNPVNKTFGIGCLRSDQKKFSITRINYKNSESDASRFFNENSLREKWPNAKIEKSIYVKFPIIDVSISNTSSCAFIRYVLVKPDVLAMISEAPKSSCKALEIMRKEFFMSLLVENN
jgi:hypothetical protein